MLRRGHEEPKGSCRRSQAARYHLAMWGAGPWGAPTQGGRLSVTYRNDSTAPGEPEGGTFSGDQELDTGALGPATLSKRSADAHEKGEVGPRQGREHVTHSEAQISISHDAIAEVSGFHYLLIDVKNYLTYMNCFSQERTIHKEKGSCEIYMVGKRV